MQLTSALTMADQAAQIPALVHAIWLVPAFPIAAFVLLIAFGRRLGEPVSGWLAVVGMLGAFVASVCTWVGLRSMDGNQRSYTQHLFTWIGAGRFHVDIAFLVDPLSVTMCLFVTFVASAIFIYSIGYMKGDPDFSKFFIYLSFFAASMLVLVTGSSLLLTFLGWEGVGAASYFLIGFWFQDTANSSAAKKAFIVNRIGDWGFLVAMFFVFLTFGTFDYTTIFAHLSTVQTTTISAIVGLLFLGAIGKSAQLPLYLWLPDAMAGPTPVSALMHAATMVTAGVYLMVRINPLIAHADPWVGTTIAIVGAATAFFAATIAIAQNDIKKVLAYSTVSQLGYMMLAVGSGAYVAAIFHMITHAFFKGLLFLGAGSVITGMNSEQDMNWYGKLWKFFPITGVTFVVAWLAIAGVPPFSGFWSKGDILGFAWHKNPVLWIVGVVTALLTAYYMTREVVLTFFGKRRWTEAGPNDPVPEHATEDAEGNPLPVGPGAPHHVEHGAPVNPTESPWVMTIPMIVLAVGAFGLGILNLPFGNSFEMLNHWLEPSVLVGESTWSIPGSLEWALEIASIVLALGGIALAWMLYQRHTTTREEQAAYEPEILAKSWYYDIAISAFMGGPVRRAGEWLAFQFERRGLDGIVTGTGRALVAGAARVRLLQTGFVRRYALGLALGAVCLLAFVVYRASF